MADIADKGRAPARKTKGKGIARAMMNVEVIPMPPPERSPRNLSEREPARVAPGAPVAVVPMPVPGKKTKLRARVAP